MRRAIAGIFDLSIILFLTKWSVSQTQMPTWNPQMMPQAPPPLPLHQLPMNPERQADMMDTYGPYGSNFYPPPYPRYGHFYPPPGMYNGFMGPPPPYPMPPSYYNRPSMLPINNAPQQPPIPANPPNSETSNQTPKRIHISNPKKKPPPPQNLNAGTVYNKAHPSNKLVPRTLTKKMNKKSINKFVSSNKNTEKFKRKQRIEIHNTNIRRLPYQGVQFKVRLQTTAKPLRLNNKPEARGPPISMRHPMRPPAPPLVHPARYGDVFVGNPPGSQDGPCIPTSNRAHYKTYNGGYPPVRHQPRVPHTRRMRRAVYSLAGCTCTDIQDIDPLGGDNYITKAGYCHAFQYYCACPTRGRAGLMQPPPG